jgi:hypothetical protein
MTKLVEFGGMTCPTLHTGINILLINLNICDFISNQNFHDFISLKENTIHFPTPIEADLHFVDTSPPKKMPSSSTDHKYTPSNDSAITSAPAGDLDDNDHVTRPGHKNDPISVQSDEELVTDPIDAKTADSNAQLGTYTLIVLRMRIIFG